jgi:hypothetical protein
MDANYGAVEPQYMQKSAVGGDPYSCLFQRILVLPNKPAPPGFRQHEVNAYWPKENGSGINGIGSRRGPKKRKSSKTKKKKNDNPTATTSIKNNLTDEIQTWRKERDQRKAAAVASKSLNKADKQDKNRLQPKHQHEHSLNVKKKASEVAGGDANNKRRLTSNAFKKNTSGTHHVPSRIVGKPSEPVQRQRKQNSLEPPPESPCSPSNTKPILAPQQEAKFTETANPVKPQIPKTTKPSATALESEIALQKLEAEAKASSKSKLLIKPAKPPSTSLLNKNLPLSPRAAKTAEKLAAAKLTNRNSKANVPASMLPTIRAKVKKASLIINDLLEQHEKKNIRAPTLGAAQAVESLRDVSQSIQGAAIIRDDPNILNGMSKIVEIFVKIATPKNEVVAPCLMALSSICRRFTQMAENTAAKQLGSADSSPVNIPMIYSMIGCKMLLQLSIKCALYLHDVVSQPESNEALESGVPRLAASAHLLKGLAEYCTFSSNPPTTRELQTRDLFVSGGGVHVLLALSQSNLKTSSRPARVALANFDMKDLAMLASPAFELQPDSLLKAESTTSKIRDIAVAALDLEINKRNERQRRGQIGLRIEKEKREENNPKRNLEERQQKLAQWLGKRGEQTTLERESWKERDRQQKALLIAKVESEKARYAKEKKERADAADKYRQDMLNKYAKQKDAASKRRAAIAEAEESAERQKEARNQAKVEEWLKKKRETMRAERERELKKQRAAYRKNMNDLKKRKNQSFGNSDFSDPNNNTNGNLIVPGSGFFARKMGGSKLVNKPGKNQKIFGNGNKQSTSAPPDNVPSFGITGHNFR